MVKFEKNKAILLFETNSDPLLQQSKLRNNSYSSSQSSNDSDSSEDESEEDDSESDDGFENRLIQIEIENAKNSDDVMGELILFSE